MHTEFKRDVHALAPCLRQAHLGPDVLDKVAAGRALRPCAQLEIVIHPLDARWRRVRRLGRAWQRHRRWLAVHMRLPERAHPVSQ